MNLEKIKKGIAVAIIVSPIVAVAVTIFVLVARDREWWVVGIMFFVIAYLWAVSKLDH